MQALSRKLFVLIATGGLSACATIVGGRYQPVEVNAQGADNRPLHADCTLKNDRGEAHVVTPGSATVHRSAHPLQIQCTENGAQVGQQSLSAGTRGMVWGNILFGGLIGIVVDFADGAAHHYPQTVTVLTSLARGAAPDEATDVASPAGSAPVASAAEPAASPSAHATASPAADPAANPDRLASLDARIGPPVFNAAQNVAAARQCDRAIRVAMADGDRALFESRCPGSDAPLRIECERDQCVALRADAATAAHAVTP